MKFLKTTALAAAGVAMTLGGALSPIPAMAGPQNQPTVPIEVWSLRDSITAMQLSPDGKHILLLKNESKEGENILEIYATADMSKPLRRLNADPMELISARWVSNNYIFGTAWQQKRKSVKKQEEDSRSYRTYSYNLDKNKFNQVEGNFSIVSTLPDDPNTVLVQTGRGDSDLTGVDPFDLFRPRSYYRYNLESGARSLVLKGTTKYPFASFDNNGYPRFTQGQDDDKTVRTYYRKPGDGSWKQFGPVLDQNDPSQLYRLLGGFQGPAGFDPSNPNIGYMIEARNGADKASLWEFNFETGEYTRELFKAENADVMGILQSSIPGDERLVAAVYPGAKMEYHWFDEEEKALYAQLEQLIPNAHQVRISSRSLDGQSMIVTNSGPRDPGSYWFVKDGKIVKLGSRNPYLKPDQLSDVEFIRYPARDGMMIPGYVTKPKGEGPFPLIVLPHGGPAVPEVVGYDEWGQLLANAGYMVLQPGYRQTVGWGQKHFDAAYDQHGYAMQDDKDDGALYLVEQGLVDPDRIAMFGWSYGGYAALVAAQREDNIYQCAIAGAAVSRADVWYRDVVDAYAPKALDDWFQTRGVKTGVHPYNDVAKTNIPLLMVHGDVDRRVLYYHMKDFKDAADKLGKTNIQYLTLKGADHFYTTLMYEHQEAFYTKMLDYLANDCGPGGL
ncbi:alpha/beta hydrolase family protein [Parerythrobacter aestuarii]|uniref:alpha/beta hydrolase family protein n=1 Tax=Parerythrobacter aestuarii TaxID=3020909 RepID=UPI0024DEA9A9|nr:prolyl oligopeptidase family serine peptidase [Parerythrobacter aestuarii]